MRNRWYVIGALLSICAVLAVPGTAFAGAPQSQTLTQTVAPAKLDKKAFSGVTLHNVIITNYDNFSGSPSAKETIFFIDKNVKITPGNIPPCPQTTLNAATTTAAVQAACGASIVGDGTNLVNNGTGAFTQPNPVLLVGGGPTTLYVWTRIAGALTLVLNGAFNPAANTLDVTGLPNTPGTDLTNFDTTFFKKKSGKKSFFIAARCPKKKKLVTSETTTYYNGQQLSATSPQRCKQKKSKKSKK